MQFYEFTHFRTELSLYLRLEKDKALQKIQVMDLTIPPSINWKKNEWKKTCWANEELSLIEKFLKKCWGYDNAQLCHRKCKSERKN